MSSFEKSVIVDSSGSAIEKKGSVTQTLGASGGAVYGGYIGSNEKNAGLSGTRKFKTYGELLTNVSIVAAAVRYFLNVLGRSNWRVEPAEFDSGEDKNKADKYADLIEQAMEDCATPWKRIIRRGAMYRFHGFSVQEWTAVRDMELGHFKMKDIEPRPQTTIERWDVDEFGTVNGVWQMHPQTYIEHYLPRNKIVYIVDDTLNDSPEGLGLLRSVVASAKRLERYEELEMFGFETDLRGIPVGRIPYAEIAAAEKSGQLNGEQAKNAINNVEDFVKNHIKNPALGITLDSVVHESKGDSVNPSGTFKWDVSLLTGEGGNFEAIGSSIDRLSHEIARVLGSEHLLLGQTRGTQALSVDKSDNFGMVVDSTLEELSESYTMDFVGRMFDINGWDRKYMPCLKPGKIQHRDIQTITGALNDMASAGAVLDLDDPAINEVRDELGLSRQVLDALATADAVIPNVDLKEPKEPKDPEKDPKEPDDKKLEDK